MITVGNWECGSRTRTPTVKVLPEGMTLEDARTSCASLAAKCATISENTTTTRLACSLSQFGTIFVVHLFSEHRLPIGDCSGADELPLTSRGRTTGHPRSTVTQYR